MSKKTYLNLNELSIADLCAIEKILSSYIASPLLKEKVKAEIYVRINYLSDNLKIMLDKLDSL